MTNDLKEDNYKTTNPITPSFIVMHLCDPLRTFYGVFGGGSG